jgi:hypothetical protein
VVEQQRDARLVCDVLDSRQLCAIASPLLRLAIDRRPERSVVAREDDRHEMRPPVGRDRGESRDRPRVQQVLEFVRGDLHAR